MLPFRSESTATGPGKIQDIVIGLGIRAVSYGKHHARELADLRIFRNGMHSNRGAPQMDAILRPSNARSPVAYIFVLARGAAICRGGVRRSIQNHRLSA